jgi:hypothetical protein
MESLYKLCAESFDSKPHLKATTNEANALLKKTLASS